MTAPNALDVASPDLVQDGVVRWSCSDLRGVFAPRFALTLHERTVGKLLPQLRLTRLQPRPYHPKKDAEAQEALKNLNARVVAALPAHAAGKPVEIWFQDEASVGQ